MPRPETVRHERGSGPPERASYAQQHVGRSAMAASEASGGPIVCEQRAGEVFLLPPLWGHATVNLEPAVGFATELAPTTSFTATTAAAATTTL